MSADLHLHVRAPECTEAVLDVFFCNTLGAKRSADLTDILNNAEKEREQRAGLTWEQCYDIIANTPSYWIGEVSWLKGVVPAPVEAVNRLVADEPVLTPELAARILEALELPNQSPYSVTSGTAASERSLTAEESASLKDFLDSHLGEQLFAVSW